MRIKQTLGHIYIKYKLRVARGSTFTAEVQGLINAMQQGGVILLLISSYFSVKPPLWILPVLWLAQKIVEFSLGWLDEKKLHWWQFEMDYNSRNLNPFNKELLEKITLIEQYVKERQKQESNCKEYQGTYDDKAKQ